jgi:acyl dehydratase
MDMIRYESINVPWRIVTTQVFYVCLQRDLESIAVAHRPTCARMPMALDPNYLLSLPPRIVRQTYTRRDTMLYALGVGAGHDVLDLPFVYEEGLKALPSMAVVLAYPGFWQREPQYGIAWKRVLHAEQSLLVHNPLPVEGTVRGEMTIDRIVDKGVDKGALLYSTRRIIDESHEVELASVRQVSFLRGDGGCGGSSNAVPQPHPIPERVADYEIALNTRPEQALIYRLSGDYNPLHVDPGVAHEVGLPRPILHGLCTFGFAARALLRSLCRSDPSRLKRIDCRFTAPVYPGDTICVSVWRHPHGRAVFQACAQERGALVLNNGYAEFEDS